MQKSGKRKVLIITYYWPPAGGGGVQRWLKFARYLPEFGWEPEVYAPENADYPLTDATMEAEVASDTVVIRQPIFEARRVFNRLGWNTDKESNGPGLDQLFYVDPADRTWKQKLALWIRGNIFIPDARMFWIKPSIRFLKEYLKANPVDAIVSSGPPHSMHVIAHGVKKHFPDIPWVADFRDPWTEIEYYDKMPMSKRADNRHRTLEKEVVTTADAVITVSPSWGEMFQQKGAVNTHVITNGYDMNDFAGMRRQLDDGHSAVTICHSGTMARDRNPLALWSVLGSLSSDLKVLMKFLGQTDMAVLEAVTNAGISYTDLGYIAHNLAVHELFLSNVLLLLQNEAMPSNVRGRIPGKIFEYLASGCPILCIGDPKSDVAAMLRNVKHARVAQFGNTEDIRSALMELIEISGDKTTTPASETYTRQSLTRRLSEVLDSLTISARVQGHSLLS